MRRPACAWLCAAVVLGFGVPALAADATGTWKWTIEINGNTMDRSVKLKQEGDKLTGTYFGFEGTETAIQDGKVKGDMVSFKVPLEFNDVKITLTYSGKVMDDTLKGEVKIERDGDSQTRDWEAKRAK
jgi:hypothetical protein